jgi:hypothetical protein
MPDRHHPVRLAQKAKNEPAKNKSQNRGMFLDAKKQPSTNHDLPRNSPQLHHKITTPKHRFSQKPLQNGPSTTRQKKRPGKSRTALFRIRVPPRQSAVEAPYTPA